MPPIECLVTVGIDSHREHTSRSLQLADPGARLLALWAMRGRSQRLGQQAAEEEAQGAGASRHTPEGNRILGEAARSARAHPLVQAMLLAGLRVQLDILPAITELSVGSPSRHHIDDLPDPLPHTCRALRRLPSAEALPWLAQQVVWHWGGTLRRPDLAALAAGAELPAEAAFALLKAASRLHRNWHAATPPEATLHRKNKRREQALLARPVVRVDGTPGLLRTMRQRLPSADLTPSVEVASGIRK